MAHCPTCGNVCDNLANAHFTIGSTQIQPVAIVCDTTAPDVDDCQEISCCSFTATITGNESFTIPAGAVSWRIQNLGDNGCCFGCWSFQCGTNPPQTIPGQIFSLGSEALALPNNCEPTSSLGFETITVIANPDAGSNCNNTVFIMYTICG